MIMLTSSVWALSTVFRISRPCEAAADKALQGGTTPPSTQERRTLREH